jgi:hypothetical protein|nr:MAG TPA: hypothetical protein [Caudoviricetes sp.]
MPLQLKNSNATITLQAPIVGGGAVDSVNGMTGDVVLDIPSKTSQLENDSDFATNSALKTEVAGLATKKEVAVIESKIPNLEGYATEQWVEAKGYLTEHQSLENYAFRSEIPTKTSDLTNDSGFLTEHQSLAAYALKSEIPTVPTNVSALTNDSGYLTLATLPKYDGGVE